MNWNGIGMARPGERNCRYQSRPGKRNQACVIGANCPNVTRCYKEHSNISTRLVKPAALKESGTKSVDMSIDGMYEIVEMEQWDKADIDLVEPGYIRIAGKRGELHFICVDGQMDIRKDKTVLYKFSWDGNDEYDPASGFGEFVCEGDNLTGRIYIHDGDDSSFVAKKIAGEGRR